MATIVGVLAAMALGLSVVSAGMNAKTIYNIEMDRSYVEAADRALMQARSEVEKRLQNAQLSKDPIAIAQAKELRDRLQLLLRRVKLSAVNRQVEQTKESFRDEEWRQYVVQKTFIDAGGRLLSWRGLGKVRDAYTRRSNWPPDPSKSFLTWDPQTKQAVRVMFDRDRPQFYAAIYEDDLKDAFEVVLNGYDAMSSAAQAHPLTAEEALAAVREGLERMGSAQTLPETIGDYLAIALLRQVAAENPQIQGMPEVEQEAFVCDQTRRRLQRMAADEADLDRSAIIRAAIDQLTCSEPSVPPANAGDSNGPPRKESQPAVPAKPDPLPWTYKGKASSRESVTTRWGQAASTTLTTTPDIQVTLHPDGTAEATYSVAKTIRYYCDPSDRARDGTLQVADVPRTGRFAGTHANGEITLNAGASELRGSYSAESITGSLRGQTTQKTSCGEIVFSDDFSFTMDRAKGGEANR